MGQTQRVAILGIINSDPVAKKSEDISIGITSPSSSKPAGEYLHNDRSQEADLFECKNLGGEAYRGSAAAVLDVGFFSREHCRLLLQSWPLGTTVTPTTWLLLVALAPGCL